MINHKSKHSARNALIALSWALFLIQAKTSLARDYNHEVFSYVEYSRGFGSLHNVDEPPTRAHLTATHVDVGYGYFWGDRTEPIFEFSYKDQKKIVGNYVSNFQSYSTGAGMLFNIPLFSLRPPDADPPIEQANTPVISYSRFIPYGGFIIIYETSKEKDEALRDGALTQTEVNSANHYNKLVFGMRFILFPHIALNSSIRISYREANNQAKTSDKTGGTIKSVLIEARLLSLAILF